jgi:hypothetical protein
MICGLEFRREARATLVRFGVTNLKARKFIVRHEALHAALHAVAISQWTPPYAALDDLMAKWDALTPKQQVAALDDTKWDELTTKIDP